MLSIFSNLHILEIMQEVISLLTVLRGSHASYLVVRRINYTATACLCLSRRGGVGGSGNARFSVFTKEIHCSTCTQTVQQMETQLILFFAEACSPFQSMISPKVQS